MRILAYAPIALYAVAAGLGLAGLLTDMLSVPVTSGILILAGVFFVLSLALSYFTVRGDTRPASTAFIGQLFAVGFWRGSRMSRLGFLLLGTIAVLIFAAGAVVLSRGTTVEKVGDAYYSVNSGQRVALTSAEAHYLQNAQNILVPIGGAMMLCIFSAGLLRGASIVRRERTDGLMPNLLQ
ncbi:hypothetical protein [Leifsonia sp. NPDC058230]|uniref:hypothetical protein n=1 Tax=Leifsonia sp. NPDC058230 TaxID=3346391 RepID=UPI0036DDBEDA